MPIARDRVVATFWLPDGEPPEQAVVHAYGPYTLAEARRVKREFDHDDRARAKPGLYRNAVCKVIDVDAMNAPANNTNKEE